MEYLFIRISRIKKNNKFIELKKHGKANPSGHQIGKDQQVQTINNTSNFDCPVDDHARNFSFKVVQFWIFSTSMPHVNLKFHEQMYLED